MLTLGKAKQLLEIMNWLLQIRALPFPDLHPSIPPHAVRFRPSAPLVIHPTIWYARFIIDRFLDEKGGADL